VFGFELRDVIAFIVGCVIKLLGHDRRQVA
jgi:hypothetical protein